jgi:tripartite-type tricarboxylate transporter receptor subunit TctC
MQAPEVKAKLVAAGLRPVGMCGADFDHFLHQQHDDYGRVIGQGNKKID